MKAPFEMMNDKDATASPAALYYVSLIIYLCLPRTVHILRGGGEAGGGGGGGVSEQSALLLLLVAGDELEDRWRVRQHMKYL